MRADSCSKVGRILCKCGSRSIGNESTPVAIEMWPGWPNLRQTRPELTHCEPISAKFGRNSIKVARDATKCDHFRAEFGRVWTDFDYFRPMLARFGKRCAEVGQIWTDCDDIVQIWLGIRQICAEADRRRAEVDQRWPELDEMFWHPGCGKINLERCDVA